MNKEKINDLVNVWANAVGLTETRYINVIKSDIAKRCSMYEKEIPSISIKDDNCAAYIIKPVDGKYSIEDFLLNRLMLGLREVDFSDALEGNGGDYTARDKSLNINVGLLDSKINEKSARHTGLKGKNIQIIKKTIEHELGHCFKSSFTDGYKAPLGRGREQDDIYEKMISDLLSYKNGKYANQIKTVQELNHQGESDVVKTGVNDAKVNYQLDYRIKWIDELLNETEALELTNSNEVHEKWVLQDENGRDSSSGNYVDVYNYISGYSTFTGYGSILKSLLGKEDSFYAEYISSADIFNKFDEEYADMVQDVWGLNPKQVPPMRCIFLDFNDLVNGKFFNEKIMLKLDEFFAKCYEKKVNTIINQNNGILSQEFKDLTLKEIQTFKERLTTNDDPQKREALVHNVIFNNIKTRMTQLEIGNEQEKIGIDKQESIHQEKASPIENEKRMKFVNNFIQAYDDTETEYLYELRSKDEDFNIQRVQDIIETNGLNRMFTMDLDGKWIGTPQDEDFKVQYSQKQVSAMVRLLKAAQLLTDNKKLNPTGINYLEEFSSVPDIEYKLKQMHRDLKDSDSYMFELKETAKANRANGTLPNFPETPGEIEASDSSSTRSASGKGVKQEMGISASQAEKIEQAKNDARRQEDDSKRKEDEEEIITNNEESAKQQKKLSVQNVKRDISNSKVTNTEFVQSQEEIAEIKQRSSLLFRSKLGNLSAEEQQRLAILNAKYGEPEIRQSQSNMQRKSNGMGR